MFFNKRTDISHDYFHEHWAHVHADLVAGSRAWKDNKILRYTQYHQTPEMKQEAADMGYPMMEWDACSEFWVTKLSDMHSFLKSEEYLGHDCKLKLFGHVQCYDKCSSRIFCLDQIQIRYELLHITVYA
jgi:hypothetical protein